MEYREAKRKVLSIVDGSRNKLKIEGRNFVTDEIIGYYKGVEISLGYCIDNYLVGVTFTTDKSEKISEHNRCFSINEIGKIQEYINNIVKE